jgi:hypothetical protein
VVPSPERRRVAPSRLYLLKSQSASTIFLLRLRGYGRYLTRADVLRTVAPTGADSGPATVGKDIQTLLSSIVGTGVSFSNRGGNAAQLPRRHNRSGSRRVHARGADRRRAHDLLHRRSQCNLRQSSPFNAFQLTHKPEGVYAIAVCTKSLKPTVPFASRDHTQQASRHLRASCRSQSCL